MHDRLTQGDIDKIKAEISERKLVIRPKLLDDLKTAREQGDLSENFEYYAAKRAKNQNESRIRYLENMLKTAHLIRNIGGEDEVTMDREIEIAYPDDDETETLRIVTTIRSKPLQGLISIDSPMGKALLHHKVGDTVFIPTDAGGYEVIITRIGDDVDESGDAIRNF
ncbi:MAG: transcription elongation factor GreA [Lachnospiraceae bacterium]|nr:transcription elongation factor GreA [Lachnospiraceae bacterium]